MAGGTGSGDPTGPVRNPGRRAFPGSAGVPPACQEKSAERRQLSMPLRKRPGLRPNVLRMPARCRRSQGEKSAPHSFRPEITGSRSSQISLGDTESFWATQKTFGRHRKISGDTELLRTGGKPLWATQKVSTSPVKILGGTESLSVADRTFGRHKNSLRRPKKFSAT